RRPRLKLMETSFVSNRRLSPFACVWRKFLLPPLGIFHALGERRMVTEIFRCLVITHRDHVFEEIIEMFRIPSGAGIEQEAILVGLVFLSTREAHVDELPGCGANTRAR